MYVASSILYHLKANVRPFPIQLTLEETAAYVLLHPGYRIPDLQIHPRLFDGPSEAPVPKTVVADASDSTSNARTSTTLSANESLEKGHFDNISLDEKSIRSVSPSAKGLELV